MSYYVCAVTQLLPSLVNNNFGWKKERTFLPPSVSYFVVLMGSFDCDSP